jgi:hypothetical protein
MDPLKPGLQAPKVISSDPNDPLSPGAIRSLHLTTEKAVIAYKDILRKARYPETEPHYNQVMATLKESHASAIAALSAAHTRCSQKAELKCLASGLDMKLAKNIEEYSKRMDEYDEAYTLCLQLQLAERALHDMIYGPST